MLKVLIEMQSIVMSIQSAAVLMSACLLLVSIAWYFTRNKFRTVPTKSTKKNWYDRRCNVLTQRHRLNRKEQQVLKPKNVPNVKRRSYFEI